MLIKILFLVLITKLQISFSKSFPLLKKEIEHLEITNIKSIDIKSYEEYTNYIKNNDYIIALFHANWCGHCRRFKPILDKASSYSFLNKKWVFLKIDCTSDSFICKIMNIQFFPTIKIYKEKKLLYKQPPRELNPLIQFLYKIGENPLIKIKSSKYFFEKYGEYSPLIEYKKGNNESEFIKCINELANNEFLEYFYFGIYESEKDKEKIIFSDNNNNLSNFNIFYEWDGNCTNAFEFLYENKYPLLNEINQEFLEEIARDFKVLIFVVTFLKNKIINNFIFSSLKNISFNNRKYLFGYVDYSSDTFVKNFFGFNLNNTYEMKLIIYDFNKRNYYIHDKIFNFENQNEKTISDEIKNLINNIKKLKFTSGSKIRDIFNFINFDEMSPYEQVLVVGIFVIILLIIIYLLFHFSGKENNENEQEEEDEYDEFFDEIKDYLPSNNKNNKQIENKSIASTKQKMD